MDLLDIVDIPTAILVLALVIALLRVISQVLDIINKWPKRLPLA